MTTTKETMKKLEGLGVEMVGEVKANQSPTFETKVRSKGNVLYDEGLGFIRLGDKREKRTFVNVGQAKKFMQTVAVASKCKKFLKENSHTSIRGLFYQLKFSLGEDLEEELFSEQEESNPLIEDLEVALNIKREDLNLNTDRKGVVAGG
ncbi:MAG: DNA topoisomerase IV subunit A, partial [Candidatus Micrarchaeota archaeon]